MILYDIIFISNYRYKMYAHKINFKGFRKCYTCKGMYTSASLIGGECNTCMYFNASHDRKYVCNHSSLRDKYTCKICQKMEYYRNFDSVYNMYISEGKDQCEGCSKWFKKLDNIENLCSRCYEKYCSQNKKGVCDPKRKLEDIMKTKTVYADAVNTLESSSDEESVLSEDCESISSLEDIEICEPPRKKRIIINDDE
jgi:hypothetical protein